MNLEISFWDCFFCTWDGDGVFGIIMYLVFGMVYLVFEMVYLVFRMLYLVFGMVYFVDADAEADANG